MVPASMDRISIETKIFPYRSLLSNGQGIRLDRVPRYSNRQLRKMKPIAKQDVNAVPISTFVLTTAQKSSMM
jgi:hypothetical protein